MSYDGKVVIDVELSTKEIEGQLNQLKNAFNGLGDITNIFDGISNSTKQFGSVFTLLKDAIGTNSAAIVASITTAITAFDKLYKASTQNFLNNFKNIAGNLEGISNHIISSISDVANSIIRIGEIPTSIGEVVDEFSEYNLVMQEVKAISNATEEEFQQLLDLTASLGRETVFTATDAAEGLKYMAMAGWSAQKSIAGLPSVLRLAQIGCTDLGTASDIITDVLTAMGMQATDAGDMVDMFTAAITRSNTNVEMLGTTLSYCAPIAGSLGIEFEDLALAAGLLANSGIKASKAGTSLRTFMTNLAGPTETVSAAMQKYGIVLKETAAGTVDLDATMQSLRKSLGDLPLQEQTAAAKALFGKTGMAGGLTIISASEEHYNSLKEAIEGSTESMTYWRNECEKSNLSNEETSKTLDNLHKVFQEAKDMADAIGATSTDLTFSVSLLGLDNKVSTDNIENLFTVMNELNNASKEQQAIMKANGIQISKNDDDTLNYNESLKNVVNTLRSKTKEEREAILTNLGLADSIDEINELCSISSTKFDEVAQGIAETQSAAEKAQEIIDSSLVGAAKALGSAVSGLGLVITSQAAPALSSLCRWLADVFNLLAKNDISGAFEEFTEGLERGLKFIENLDITGAISNSIQNCLTFIRGGSLEGILDIGEEIVHQICEGIIQDKNAIRKGISSMINEIALFIKEISPEIGEAGKVILDALRDGIKDNSSEIHDALDSVASAMDSWIKGSTQIKSLTGNFADIFIDSFIQNLSDRFLGRSSELWRAMTSWITQTPSSDFSIGPAAIFDRIKDYFLGEAYADEKTGNEKSLTNNNATNKLSSMNTSEVQSQLNDMLTIIQSTSNIATQNLIAMQNTIRTSMVACANITRNQFVSISNVIKNQSLNARNALTTQMISMKNVSRTQIKEARDAVTSQMISMKNVVSTQSREARNSFTSQMISMRNVASTQSKLIGQQIASGLATGIKSGSSNAIAAARNLVNQVNAEMKKAAKINSPSKVTVGYGESYDEGLIVGMQNKSKNVTEQARRLINSLNSEMNSKFIAQAKSAVLSQQNRLAYSSQSIINRLDIQHEINGSIQGLYNLIEDTIGDKIERLSDRPVYVEASMDKTKVVNILSKPISNRNREEQIRQNRLKGVTI